jgi:uncharacterized glyoxalase superfamily protein PhnB
MGKASGVPAGYHTVTPYLIARDAAGLLDFLERAFGARVTERVERPESGTIAHAEVVIGDSRVMAAETTDVCPVMPAMLYVYVEDCDQAYGRALAAGATSLMEPADQPHGDRHGGVLDAYGNQWWMATRLPEGAGRQ